MLSEMLPGEGEASPVPAAVREVRLRAGEMFVAATGELRDIGRHRFRRRMWCRGGEAHLEVRGLAGADAGVLGEEVTEALSRLKGVHWAEINQVTQQVLVSFDEDHVDLPALVDAIEAVEAGHGAQSQPFSRTKPEIPGDRAVEYASTAAVASGLAGVALATAGRLSLRALPPQAIRLPIVLTESQPQLRAALESRSVKRPRTCCSSWPVPPPTSSPPIRSRWRWTWPCACCA
ncbi:hypothetical protein GCM10029978_045980 [Actinoallomurus acanthiterrae]